MDPLPPELTLDRFVVEMSRVPARRPDPRALPRARRRGSGSPTSSSRAARASCDDEYARNLVLRTPHFELLVLCWRPGQHSTIHDHAGALNAIRVRSGELTSRVFRPAAGAAPGGGPVDFVSEEHVGPRRSARRRRPGRHPPARRHLRRAARHRARVRPAAARAHRVRHGDGRRREAAAALQPRRRTSDERRGAAPVRPARPLVREAQTIPALSAHPQLADRRSGRRGRVTGRVGSGDGEHVHSARQRAAELRPSAAH